MPVKKINKKEVIKNVYYHCFKLGDVYYALFDIKMDMPILIESLSIVSTERLPKNSVIFEYKISSNGYFEKTPKKYMKVHGDGKHQKAPRTPKLIDEKKLIYHHFKLSSTLSVLFDDDLSKPIEYGSNQKIQGALNNINKEATIFYYHEDITLKNSFKFFRIHEGKKS